MTQPMKKTPTRLGFWHFAAIGVIIVLASAAVNIASEYVFGKIYGSNPANRCHILLEPNKRNNVTITSNCEVDVNILDHNHTVQHTRNGNSISHIELFKKDILNDSKEKLDSVTLDPTTTPAK